MKKFKKYIEEGRFSPKEREELDDLITRFSNSLDPNDDYPDEDPDDVIKLIRKQFGDKIANTVEAGADKFHWPRAGHTYGWDRLDKPGKRRITKKGKLNKQDVEGLKSTIKRNLGLR